MVDMEVILGYDIRVSGDLWRSFCADQGFKPRSELLTASFDPMACPSVLSSDDPPEFSFQRYLPASLHSDHFFETYELFRSDRDALSYMGEPAPVDGSRNLYKFTLVTGFPINTEPLKGLVRSMDGDNASEPTLDFRLLGFELIDESLVSITHLYHDLSGLQSEITPENLGNLRKELKVNDCVLIKIEVATHQWWFPHANQPDNLGEPSR